MKNPRVFIGTNVNYKATKVLPYRETTVIMTVAQNEMLPNPSCENWRQWRKYELETR